MSAGEKTGDMPLVLRGSLITLRRKCGRPGCHCARGELHETPALSLNLDGKTKILTLRAADIPEVKTALGRYKQERAAMQAALDQHVRAGVTRLRTRRAPPETTPRKATKKGALSSSRR